MKCINYYIIRYSRWQLFVTQNVWNPNVCVVSQAAAAIHFGFKFLSRSKSTLSFFSRKMFCWICSVPAFQSRWLCPGISALFYPFYPGIPVRQRSVFARKVKWGQPKRCQIQIDHIDQNMTWSFSSSFKEIQGCHCLTSALQKCVWWYLFRAWRRCCTTLNLLAPAGTIGWCLSMCPSHHSEITLHRRHPLVWEVEMNMSQYSWTQFIYDFIMSLKIPKMLACSIRRCRKNIAEEYMREHPALGKRSRDADAIALPTSLPCRQPCPLSLKAYWN